MMAQCLKLALALSFVAAAMTFVAVESTVPEMPARDYLHHNLVHGIHYHVKEYLAELRETSPDSINFISSPYSFYTSVAYLMAGAGGATRESFAELLTCKSSEHASFMLEVESVIAKSENDLSGFTVANCLFVNSDSISKRFGSFTQKLEYEFAATPDLGLIAFDSVDDASGLKSIDDWASDVDNDFSGKLVYDPEGENIIPVGVLKVLPHWAQEFTKSFTGDFFDIEGNVISGIPYMTTTISNFAGNGYGMTTVEVTEKVTRARKADAAQKIKVEVIEIPFARGDTALVIFKPTTADGIAMLEREWKTGRNLLNQLLTVMDRNRNNFGDAREAMVLTIPRFTLQTSIEGSNIVESIMDFVMDRDVDFSGFLLNDEVKVKAMPHSWVLEIGEGGEPAASKPMDPVIVVNGTVNSPFLFQVRSKTSKHHTTHGRGSDVILLQGKFVNPNELNTM